MQIRRVSAPTEMHSDSSNEPGSTGASRARELSKMPPGHGRLTKLVQILACAKGLESGESYRPAPSQRRFIRHRVTDCQQKRRSTWKLRELSVPPWVCHTRRALQPCRLLNFELFSKCVENSMPELQDVGIRWALHKAKSGNKVRSGRDLQRHAATMS